MIDKLNFIHEHIKNHAIARKENGHVIIGSNGQKQNWLMDLRSTLMDVAALDAICDMFWDRFQDKLPFQFGGMEVAAIPFVVGLMMKASQRGLKTNGFIIRKERKNTGLAKSIEGKLNDDPIILIDDLINSGESLEKARAVLQQEGRTVSQVFTIVDYQSRKGLQWRQQNRIPVSSFFKLSEFDLEIDVCPPPYRLAYSVVWRHYTKGAYPFHLVPKSGPLLVGDYLYIGTSTAHMLCLNRHTGAVVWDYFAKGAQNNVKGIMSFPAYHGGRIYFGAYNGVVYCLDALTGAEVWLNPCCEWVGSSPLIVSKHNMLYIGLEYQRPRSMGSNAALRLDTGARVWEVGQKKYQHGSAVYYEPMDAVIFGNANHDITAYDALTGREIWQYKTERSIKYPPSINISHKLVASSSFDGKIYINDVETGDLRAAIATDDICYSTPLFVGGKVFCGSGDRHMYIIDIESFELLDKIDCGARIFSSPRLIDGNVVFGTNGGRILEINPITHEIVGKAQLPDAVTNIVVPSPDFQYFYARTHLDEIFSLKRKNIMQSNSYN